MRPQNHSGTCRCRYHSNRCHFESNKRYQHWLPFPNHIPVQIQRAYGRGAEEEDFLIFLHSALPAWHRGCFLPENSGRPREERRELSCESPLYIARKYSLHKRTYLSRLSPGQDNSEHRHFEYPKHPARCQFHHERGEFLSVRDKEQHEKSRRKSPLDKPPRLLRRFGGRIKFVISCIKHKS